MRFLLEDVMGGAAVTGAGAANILTSSDDQSNSAWLTLNSPVIAANSQIAPDGTTTACSIRSQNTGTAGSFWHIRQPVSVVSGEVLAFSVSAREGASNASKRYLAVHLWYSAGESTQAPGVVIDLATGAVVLNSWTLGVSTSAEANGYWRVNVIARADATTNIMYRINARDEANKGALFGGTAVQDGSGIDVWRAQCVRLGAHVSPIKTTTAAASGSGWSSTLPPGNVLLPGRSRVARSTGLTGAQVLTANLTASVPINCVVLGDHTLTTAGTWAVELWSGTGQTGTLVGYVSPRAALSVAALGGRGLSVAYLAAPVSARSIRVTLCDPTNPAGYIQVGRMLAGQYIEPAAGLEPGVVVAWQDLGSQSRQHSGTLLASARPRVRTLSGDLALLTTAERAALHRQLYTAGTSRDIFASVWHGLGAELERDHQLVGKFTRLPAPRADSGLAYSTPFEISES